MTLILILEHTMVDNYTKFLLTVIAFCLTIMVVRDIPDVSAARTAA
jgi:hypothetical protein